MNVTNPGILCSSEQQNTRVGRVCLINYFLSQINQLFSGKLPKYYRPTCIAPGYPMMPGKDSIPRTSNYSKRIKLHKHLAAGK